MTITISTGNTKIGKIPNISLTPVISCIKNAPCTRDCYAMKAYNMWPNVKKSWDKNFKIFEQDPISYFNQIDKWIKTHNPTRFRWHVGGDIPTEKYLKSMILIAEKNKYTEFLCYTKRYSWVEKHINEIPKNLIIVLSMWPGLDVPTFEISKAWIRYSEKQQKEIPPKIIEKYNKSLPQEYFKCLGGCDKCGKCWEIIKLKIDVMFEKH